MLRNKIQLMLTTGLLGAALLLVPDLVQAADVSDGGGFFSAGAIAKANEAIRALEKKSGHDVRIETFATVPDGKAQAVSKMDAKEREMFFSNWLHDRAEATKSRGVVILICKDPSHLRLWAGKPLERAGFGAAQAKPITAALLTGFKAKEYDKALNDTVTQLTTALEGLHAVRGAAAAPAHPANPIPHKTTPQPAHHERPAAQQTGYGGLIFVMAIVIGGIVVISLLSRLFGGRQSGAGPGGGYGGGGGGGFMQGLAGGIFGAVAGNWLYNQFSGGHAHGSDSNWTGSDSSGGASNDSSSNSDSGFGGGTDFGGGDFGGGGGGGDAGGGDF